jgi:hypothetical protein
MTGTILDELAAALEPLGMVLRGGFTARQDDALPELTAGRPARTLLLVGNAGPAMYRQFFDAPESTLDGWTQRVLGPLAAHFGARALFPFGDPPWHPFQRWAKQAEGLRASPLGILIHPEYGLWHAYRAALLFDRDLPLPGACASTHACDECQDRPCLSACPVGAITTDGYDVKSCAAHVASAAGSECRSNGCLARRACPVGRDYIYPAHVMEFHMAAFLKGHAPEK